MLRCNPDDLTIEPCAHLTSVKMSLDSATEQLISTKSLASFASAKVHRLFAANELKIFGSFIAVTVFLFAAYNYTAARDVGVLNQTVGSSPHPILGPAQGLYRYFFFAILIHHFRVFLGLSYTESPEDKPMDIVAVQSDEVEPDRRAPKQVLVAIERCLRAVCAVTFPVFAIFLFRKTSTAIVTVEITWAIQLICILAYDAIFLAKAVGKSPRVPKWLKITLILSSDIVNVLFGAIFVLIPFIDDWLSKASHLTSNGTLGAAAAFILIIFIVLAFVPEFVVVYMARFGRNMASVGRYLWGEPLDSLQK